MKLKLICSLIVAGMMLAGTVRADDLLMDGTRITVGPAITYDLIDIVWTPVDPDDPAWPPVGPHVVFIEMKQLIPLIMNGQTVGVIEEWVVIATVPRDDDGTWTNNDRCKVYINRVDPGGLPPGTQTCPHIYLPDYGIHATGDYDFRCRQGDIVDYGSTDCTD